MTTRLLQTDITFENAFKVYECIQRPTHISRCGIGKKGMFEMARTRIFQLSVYTMLK